MSALHDDASGNGWNTMLPDMTLHHEVVPRTLPHKNQKTLLISSPLFGRNLPGFCQTTSITISKNPVSIETVIQKNNVPLLFTGIHPWLHQLKYSH